MVDHYFSEKPKSAPKDIKFKVNILENEIIINSSSSIFSKEHLDGASKLLILYAQIEDDSSVLDLGCGYGIIGIALAKANDIQITFADINYRAISLTVQNCKENKIKNYKVKQSNSFEKIKNKFDTILLNPPQSAGKQLCFSMIEEAKEHLNPKGTLQIVARHNKGGKTLSKKMEEVFGNLETLTKTSGIRVYLSRLT